MNVHIYFSRFQENLALLYIKVIVTKNKIASIIQNSRLNGVPLSQPEESLQEKDASSQCLIANIFVSKKKYLFID